MWGIDQAQLNNATIIGCNLGRYYIQVTLKPLFKPFKLFPVSLQAYSHQANSQAVVHLIH